MKLHGSLQTNLESAILSSRRLRGRVVYSDTLIHWSDLLAHAWWEIGNTPAPAAFILTQLAKDLEAELGMRRDAGPA
ncbi:hypothetical protein Q4F19_13790 [Sphingomonas sp. BIUV-7]|uniref:Uncharacterized protein n=1 Tax=Sphingomonas natans TaxID=3063330 RepID=A0ABT8YAW2_9SPHN|nr:hypothetical protein [Sphingomonas sp. BIUV-7]MDO6415460.1 hypothetical protein [Sphingomonas sp. BIUV-7]